MNKLEVFFDYTCPFCLKGHKNLVELIGNYPNIKISWNACEAHPRPEVHGLHSDLCNQGMYFAIEKGVDIWAYHEIMYNACHKDKINIESIEELAKAVSALFNEKEVEEFTLALKSEKYKAQQLEANVYAFEKSGVWAVPSYRLDGRKLDAVEGVGVSKDMLDEFLEFCR